MRIFSLSACGTAPSILPVRHGRPDFSIHICFIFQFVQQHGQILFLLSGEFSNGLPIYSGSPFFSNRPEIMGRGDFQEQLFQVEKTNTDCYRIVAS
jgi:hypothetical protein